MYMQYKKKNNTNYIYCDIKYIYLLALVLYLEIFSYPHLNFGKNNQQCVVHVAKKT